jgi:protein-S-isoprenylcysteine O-methyltransferase Ste14
MMIPVILGYIKRIKIEERFMQEQFGEEYVNYERRTERLIPFIY